MEIKWKKLQGGVATSFTFAPHGDFVHAHRGGKGGGHLRRQQGGVGVP